MEQAGPLGKGPACFCSSDVVGKSKEMTHPVALQTPDLGESGVSGRSIIEAIRREIRHSSKRWLRRGRRRGDDGSE